MAMCYKIEHFLTKFLRFGIHLIMIQGNIGKISKRLF
jgi:hypothetical protein